MNDIYGFSDKTAFVLGLGLTGMAAARALRQAAVEVVVWDDAASLREAAVGEGLVIQDPQTIAWRSVGGLVKSPGIAMTAPAVQAAVAAGVPVVSDFDLLYRRERGRDVRFIGITGTNGKSTTTALVGHILQYAGLEAAVGGNIGTAALELPVVGDGGFYVLECSSYQLEMTHDLQVDAGVVLNLTPDHLERHKDMAAYADIKFGLLRQAKPDAVRVTGLDPDQLASLKVVTEDHLQRISLTDPVADLYVNRDGTLFVDYEPAAELADFTHNLAGPHNWQNVAAAVALTRRWVELDSIIAALDTFDPLPHRMQRVGNVNGVLFVNDSKATNGDSTVPALKSYPSIYWICGGLPKSDGLGHTVNHLGHVRGAFTIGQAGPDFARQLRDLGVQVEDCGTLDVAVQEAYRAAQAAGGAHGQPVVLLSPAAASMDQFRNFEHRGEVFMSLVEGLRSAV